MAHISEEDRAELVAYLDGELDEQSSQAFEARLTRDPPCAEAEALKKTWELLDFLPRAEPSTNFTNRTMERLSVPSTGKVAAPNPRRPAWLMPVGWAAAMLLAMTGGLLAARHLWPATTPTQPGPQVDVEALINRDKELILNKRLYENGFDIDFLRELGRSQEFGGEED